MRMIQKPKHRRHFNSSLPVARSRWQPAKRKRMTAMRRIQKLKHRRHFNSSLPVARGGGEPGKTEEDDDGHEEDTRTKAQTTFQLVFTCSQMEVASLAKQKRMMAMRMRNIIQ